MDEQTRFIQGVRQKVHGSRHVMAAAEQSVDVFKKVVFDSEGLHKRKPPFLCRIRSRGESVIYMCIGKIFNPMEVAEYYLIAEAKVGPNGQHAINVTPQPFFEVEYFSAIEDPELKKACKLYMKEHRGNQGNELV